LVVVSFGRGSFFFVFFSLSGSFSGDFFAGRTGNFL
jgi:hypothetical protein